MCNFLQALLTEIIFFKKLRFETPTSCYYVHISTSYLLISKKKAH